MTTLQTPLVCMAVSLAGCSSLGLSEWTPAMFSGDRAMIPTRLIAVWTDAVMNQPGQRGVRGIGGRMHFYTTHDAAPVKVDGLLTVFAYDDSESSAAGGVPARKFVFRPEQLATRHSVSKLGHSYSVWLPWDEVGNLPRKLTLIAQFEPVGGATVISDPARQLLPGVSSPTAIAQSTVEKSTVKTAIHDRRDDEASSVELTSHDAVAAEQDARDGVSRDDDALHTLTIDVPGDVARKWQDRVSQAIESQRPEVPSPPVDPAAAIGD